MKYLLVLLLALPLSVSAQEDYSGVWASNTAYASVTQKGNTVVVLLVSSSTYYWEAYAGTLTNGVGVVRTIASAVDATFEIEFTGSTARVTQLSCVPDPGFACAYEDGHVSNYVKVF